jgi:hypothetical protein
MCAKANAGVTMPPREGPKTQQLNLLLLRRDVGDFESALEAPGDLDALDLVDGLPFAGRLFVQRRVPHPPQGADQPTDVPRIENPRIQVLRYLSSRR